MRKTLSNIERKVMLIMGEQEAEFSRQRHTEAMNEVDDDEQVFTMPPGKPMVTGYDLQAEMIAVRGELERLRAVEELARELAIKFEARAVQWGVTRGYWCSCGGASIPVPFGQEDDLSSLLHTSTCLVARARALGLLKK